MSPSYRTPEDQEQLQERIRYLEQSLEDNAYVMDVLASTTAIFGDTEGNRSPEVIVRNTLEAVRRLLDLPESAIYLLDSDASFDLAQHDTEDDAPGDLPERVERLIQQGTFSWALHENHPVFLPAGEDGGMVLLHVISTRTRVRGMFAARPGRDAGPRHEQVLSALTLVLFNAAYALESADLYHLMERRQQALQRITERQSRELLHHMSHDSLTNLPNRMLFSDRLARAMERHAGGSGHVALILLDLDNFKRLNDALGHRAGDELIRKVATDLSALLETPRGSAGGQGASPTLSRLGGDEFGILVEGIQGLEGVVRLVTEIVRTTAVERTVADHPVLTSCSAGIAVFPYDGNEPDTLLSNADAAMYDAKERGRNGFRFYTQDLNSRTFRHFRLETDLGGAIEDDQLRLHYQPKIELATGRVVGAEALIRWDHPRLGMLPPGQFMEIAEDMTLIEQIGEWVLQQVCRDLASLPGAAQQLPHIAINVSARQLRQPNLAEEFFAITEEHGIPADRIELELTESVIMDDADTAARVFQRLREVGMSLAVDDFGTGHASLTQLKQLPADTLKIDRSFVMDLEKSQEDAKIVRAIVVMARSLDMQLVAEGVETDAQIRLLRDFGCDYAQGFRYSRPVPFEDLREMIVHDVRMLPESG